MRPVGVEERRRRGAVSQREAATRGPGAAREPLVEPGVDLVEHPARLAYPIRIAIGLRPALVEDYLLHRSHDVVVEDAIEHPDFDAGVPFRNQADATRMVQIEMFNDRAGFENPCVRRPPERGNA